jgi:hypothetical protein
MTIIAKTKHGYIAEISHTETANLLGWWDANYRNQLEQLQIGAEIKIHEMFLQLYAFEQTRSRLPQVQAWLREMANQIDQQVSPLVPAIETKS